MYMEQEKHDAIINDIKKKAYNNKDHSAYIRPSNYGFPKTQEGLNECAALIRDFSFVKRVKIEGQDLLLIDIE